MRICIVCPYSLSIPGGVQNQTLLLAKQFAKNGHKILVIAPGSFPSDMDHTPYVRTDKTVSRRQMIRNAIFKIRRDRLSDENIILTKTDLDKRDLDNKTNIDCPKDPFSEPGEKVFFFSAGKTFSLRANGSVAPISLSPKAALRMSRAIKYWSPDIVHIHEPFAPILSLAALLLPRHSSGYIRAGTFHRFGAGGGYKAIGPLLRFFYQKLDLCYAVSKPAQHTLTKVVGAKNARKAKIVFNGIDFDFLQNTKVGKKDPGNRPSVCFVGRLEPRKGLEVLLRAISNFDIAVNLIILGSGPEMSRLKTNYQSLVNVVWAGRVSDEEKLAHIKASDLLVAPAVSGESFGIVILEAMALSVPVICSNISGHRSSAGEAAMFVKPNDENGLQEAIREVLSDNDLRQSLIAKGLLRAREMSIENLSNIYQKDFQNILAE